MRASLWLPLSCLCLLSARYAPAQEALPSRAQREVPALVPLYQGIHAAPELSHYEEKTAALASSELRRLGFTVLEGLGRYENPVWEGHGVAGVLRNGPGKTVLIRAELDALPVEEKTGLPYASRVKVKTADGQEVGVMHACGHDLHLTCMLGVARLLVQLKERWRGTVVLVGEPAEETIDGARALLRDGLYGKVPQPDYVLALHGIGELEAGRIGYTPGYALAASRVVEVTIRGVGGHASRPNEAKDPIVIAAQFIMALQTLVSRETSPLDPVVVTVGAIHGGSKANVIPDEVKLQLSVRAFKPEVHQRLIAAIERVAQGIAAAAGVPEERKPLVKPSETEWVKPVYNDPLLAERLAGVFRRELGENAVLPIAPRMAGDDVGAFSLDGRIPLFIFMLGAATPAQVAESKRTGKALPATHSPYYAPAAETFIQTGVTAMTAAVLELLAP